jgi:hypothetical protein
MNILKLAKNLQVFLLDEIELLAEQDCIAELEKLVAQNILTFDGSVYKFCEKENFTSYSAKKYELKFADIQTPFAQAVQKYILSRNLKRKTLKNYHYQLRKHLCPYFGDIQLEEINAEILLDYMNMPRSLYTSTTIISGIVLVGTVLKWAFKEGLIKESPYLKVKHIVAQMKREQTRKERYFEQNVFT